MTTAAAEKSRDELRRRQREAFAMRSWPELSRSDLTFARYSVTHEPTGDHYQVFKGEISSGIGTAAPVAAFYFAANGDIQFLERLPGGRR